MTNSRKPLFVVKRGDNNCNVIFCPAYGRHFKKTFATYPEAREQCDVFVKAFQSMTVEEIETFVASTEFAWGTKP